MCQTEWETWIYMLDITNNNNSSSKLQMYFPILSGILLKPENKPLSQMKISNFTRLCFKSELLGLQDGSVAKGMSHQAWWLGFSHWTPHRRQARTPQHCPPTFTSAQWLECASYPCIIRNKNKEMFLKPVTVEAWNGTAGSKITLGSLSPLHIHSWHTSALHLALSIR